jgi:hypothetical protein
MHRSHLAVAAAFAFAAFEVGATVPRPELPDAAVQSCLAELRELSVAEGHASSHPFDLGKHCPGLANELAVSLDDVDTGVVEIDATSLEGLRDLRSFTTGFQRRQSLSESVSLDFDGLDTLLAEILIEESIDDTVWDRFLRWLEQYVQEGDSPNFRRFVDWLEGLDAPPWLGDVIVNTSVVLIVLLALIVVGNEVRLAGLLRRVRRKPEVGTRAAATDTPLKARTLTLDELRGLPPRQLAAGILEMVTATLAERGWLSSSSSLTNGELVRQIGQRRGGLAESFAGLVSGIEMILYGDRPPDNDTRQRLLATAKELIESADRGPATASASSR